MEVKNIEELVKYLKSLRTEQKISVNKMATLIGTSHKRVKDVEAGSGEFRITLLLKYITAVGCKIEIMPALSIAAIKPEEPEKKKEEIKPVYIKGSKKQILIEDAD